MVPVVYGGRSKDDHNRLIPEEGWTHKYARDHLSANAIINVRDFNTVKELAERLRFLHNNYHEYMKYHEWRKNWVLEKDIGLRGFRRLCELIHRRHVTGDKTRLMDNGRFVELWRDPKRTCDTTLPIELN